MSLRVQRQRISAGSNFNGTTPTATPVSTRGVEKSYAAGTHGGRFDFELTAPVYLSYIELTLGGQSSYSISKLDTDNVEHILWFSTDSDLDYQSLDDERIPLLAGEIVLVKTVGASEAMVATLGVSPHSDGR